MPEDICLPHIQAMCFIPVYLTVAIFIETVFTEMITGNVNDDLSFYRLFRQAILFVGLTGDSAGKSRILRIPLPAYGLWADCF